MSTDLIRTSAIAQSINANSDEVLEIAREQADIALSRDGSGKYVIPVSEISRFLRILMKNNVNVDPITTVLVDRIAFADRVADDHKERWRQLEEERKRLQARMEEIQEARAQDANAARGEMTAIATQALGMMHGAATQGAALSAGSPSASGGGGGSSSANIISFTVWGLKFEMPLWLLVLLTLALGTVLGFSAAEREKKILADSLAELRRDYATWYSDVKKENEEKDDELSKARKEVEEEIKKSSAANAESTNAAMALTDFKMRAEKLKEVIDGHIRTINKLQANEKGYVDQIQRYRSQIQRLDAQKTRIDKKGSGAETDAAK